MSQCLWWLWTRRGLSSQPLRQWADRHAYGAQLQRTMKQVLEIIGSNQRTGSTQDRRYGYQPRLWATSSFWLPGYMGHHSRGSLEWSTDGISLDPKGGPVSAHARAFTPTHDIEHDASVQGSVQGSVQTWYPLIHTHTQGTASGVWQTAALEGSQPSRQTVPVEVTSPNRPNNINWEMDVNSEWAGDQGLQPASSCG